jgi:TonB family protein
MVRRLSVAGAAGMALLASCTAPPPGPVQSPRAAAPPAAAPAPLIPPLTLDAYKKEFAEQVARVSPEIFSEPIPEMLKSVVVLEVTIDQEGRLQRIAVRRSNGYRALENLAMDSVRRAAPFAAPSWTVRGADGSVNFLETFLFRADGRFRIRSLVAAR